MKIPPRPLLEHRYGVITAVFVSAITDEHYSPGFVLWAANKGDGRAALLESHWIGLDDLELGQN
jgi:hypothetical protein